MRCYYKYVKSLKEGNNRVMGKYSKNSKEKTVLAVYVLKEEKEQLQRLADEENITLSYLMRRIIQSHFKKIERKEKNKNK